MPTGVAAVATPDLWPAAGNKKGHIMSKKTMLLALAAASAALFSLPVVASAGEWKIDCPNKEPTCAFTTSGLHAELRTLDEPTITCAANTGSGTATNEGTTGTLEVTFTGCKALGFFSCNTFGAASGTIKLASSVSHNIYLEDSKTKLGTLVTPATTTLICPGISSLNVSGTVIGELTQGCNVESQTFNVTFAAAASDEKTQKWEQITRTGETKYDLTAPTEGGPARTSAQIASGTITFSTGKAKTTCP
jgi:hypothetical protein